MDQTSPFKSSIRYQVCNSIGDEQSARLPAASCVTQNDLCEITISPSTSKKRLVALSSPNHYESSLLTPLIPTTTTAAGQLASQQSAPIKPTQTSSLADAHESSSSIDSLAKRRGARKSRTIDPSYAHRAASRQSVFGTLATTLTAVRKSSTCALTSAQQRLSTDNTNLFSAYQGKISTNFRSLTS